MKLNRIAVIALLVLVGSLMSGCRLLQSTALETRPETAPLVQVIEEEDSVDVTEEVDNSASIDETDDEIFEESTPISPSGVTTTNPTNSQGSNTGTNGDVFTQPTSSAPVVIAPSCVPNTSWVQYRIQPGDTLHKIANRTGTTWQVLAQANCLSDPNKIVVGQLLRVPFIPPPVVTPTHQPPAGPPPVPNAGQCWFFPQGQGQQVPIFIHPMSGSPIHYLTSGHWYSVTGRNAVHFYLTTGSIAGWIHGENGMLGGNCDNVPWKDVKTGIYYPDPVYDPSSCFFYATRQDVPVYRTAAMEGLFGSLERNLYMPVVARSNDRLQLQMGATQEGYVWQHDGGLAGTCNNVPPIPDGGVSTGVFVESYGGYTFTFPTDWQIIMNSHGLPGGTVANFPPHSQPPAAQPWEHWMTRISAATHPDGLPPGVPSLEAWARQMASNFDNRNGRMEITVPVTPINVGAFAGFYFEADGQPTRERHIFLMINNFPVLITVQGNVEMAMNILGSLAST